jgi:hypothetical protein
MIANIVLSPLVHGKSNIPMQNDIIIQNDIEGYLPKIFSYYIFGILTILGKVDSKYILFLSVE